MKKEPALQVSWSAGSSTIPFDRRSSSTAVRTSASGAASPIWTPRVRASSAYRTGVPVPLTCSRNSTAVTTKRDVRLNRLSR